ncbi:MAG TPA: hypothetical protein VEK15_08720 [Vicinamibacteria bacterium]|nr:hypothetical protein [Vicinamibacteria bacterium]
MSTFSSKGSDIDVEAIMTNIRRQIEQKRKGLYTEEEVREIAEMQLDAVLDSQEFNSDFVAAFRARDERWNYSFDPETIYASSRGGGGGLIRLCRKILNPVLKLFFNPNPMIAALSRQSDLNRYYVLLLHNMAQEMTRMNLELSNIKARLRTLGIRVDFQTKREKAFERVVGPSRPEREQEEPPRPRVGREPGQDRDSRERRRGRGGRRSFRRRRGAGGGGARPNDNRGGGSGSGSSGPRDGSGS